TNPAVERKAIASVLCFIMCSIRDAIGSPLLSASCATAAQRRSGWPTLSEAVSIQNLATALPATRQPAIAIHQGSKKCERLGFLQLLRGRDDSCRLRDLSASCPIYWSSRDTRLGLKTSSELQFGF